MILLSLVTALFHLFIPLGVGLLLAVRPARSRVSRAFGLTALLGYSGFILLAGAGWGLLGQPARLVLLVGVVALTVVAAYRARRVRSWPRGGLAWMFAVLAASLTLVTLLAVPALAGAHGRNDGAVRLHLPLERGKYLVVHGGDNAVVNQHAIVPAQRHALDIVALDSWGMRASSLLPEDLSNYRIFGRRVLAPCSGEVLAVRDDLADLEPPHGDRENPAGNHLLLYCSAEHVTLVLAHLQRGSSAVGVGQQVHAGEVLGRVGNTGNTSEPHLHIHAVRGEVGSIAACIRDATPVPVQFEGRSLVRNDIFESEVLAD